MYDITFTLIFWISQEKAVCKHAVYFTLTYLLPRMLNSSTLLNFKRKMGWSCSTESTSFLSKGKNAIPRWAFKLNGALATAERCYLICCSLEVKYVLSKQPNAPLNKQNRCHTASCWCHKTPVLKLTDKSTSSKLYTGKSH